MAADLTAGLLSLPILAAALRRYDGDIPRLTTWRSSATAESPHLVVLVQAAKSGARGQRVPIKRSPAI